MHQRSAPLPPVLIRSGHLSLSLKAANIDIITFCQVLMTIVDQRFNEINVDRWMAFKLTVFIKR